MTDLNLARWHKETPPGTGKFAQGVVTPDTVFLCSSTTAPLPAASHYGWWQWFGGVQDLVEYLRCAGLPDLIDIWFDRGSFDDTYPDQRIDPRSTLQVARERNFRSEDIPVVEEVLDLLDKAVEQSDGAAILTARRACEVFTARFGRTPTWDLKLDVFPDAAAAGQKVLDDGLAPDNGKGWLDLTAAVTAGDEGAAAVFAEALRNAESF